MEKRKTGRRVRKHTASSVKYDETDIRALFEQFVNIKRASGIAPKTIGQYKTNFAGFISYIERVGNGFDVSDITPEFIREWLSFMMSEHVHFENVKYRRDKPQGLAPATVNTRLKTIRVMFNTLNQNGITAANPVKNVENVKEAVEEIEVLSVDEIKRLFNVMDTQFLTDFRDYVLTNVLLDCMSRISETVQLRIKDIDFENGFVHIRATIAKSRKARTIPISERSLRLINELIAENPSREPSEYIFMTENGAHYDRNRFNQRLKRYSVLAGIDKRIHAHLFRHTSATHFLQNGGNTETLRRILGHANYDLIKRYAHVSNASMKKSAGEFSVLNVFSDV